MVKNKALPDSSRLSAPLSGHSLSLSLSLSLPRRFGPIKAGLMCLLSLSPMPFILRVRPGSCRGWTLANFLEEITLIEICHTKKDNHCVILLICVTLKKMKKHSKTEAE